jgi:hypothetical protein
LQRTGEARRCKYSDLFYIQGLPWSRRTEDERFDRSVTMNRFVFGGTALLGLALFVGGVSSIVARIK